MAAYNRVDGVPATASPRLLTEILRRTWGFQGYVTSDVDSVSDVYLSHPSEPTPKPPPPPRSRPGCDLNGGTTYKALPEAVRQGLLTEADIDVSLRRLFTARFKLGEFDPPHTPGSKAAPQSLCRHPAERQRLARARRPRPPDGPRVDGAAEEHTASCPSRRICGPSPSSGPTADSTAMLYGNYNGVASHPITILQGIRNAVPVSTQVMYTPGCPLVTEEFRWPRWCPPRACTPTPRAACTASPPTTTARSSMSSVPSGRD